MFTEEAIVKDVDCCGEETTLTTEVLNYDSPSHSAANVSKTSMAGKVVGIRSDPPELFGEDITDHDGTFNVNLIWKTSRH